MAPRTSLAVLALLASPAGADTFGVVADGSDDAAPAMRERIEKWAIAHDEHVVAAPLSVDGTTTLANCLVIGDRKCAAGVVAARGKTDSVVYARVEPGAVSIFWFRKQGSSAMEKLACATCSDELLASALERLSQHSAQPTGALKLTSEPPGLEAAVDGSPAGSTPVELDVAVGTHEITLVSDGRALARRTIHVERGQELELKLHASVDAPAAVAPRWPLYAIGGGAALAATGVVLIATSESATGARPTYRNTVPLGTGLLVGGAAIAAAGTYLWLTHRSGSAPTVVPTTGGAVAGWALVF